MTRWRRPSRPLILIALLLLAGAVVNVAVAWVLMGAPDPLEPSGQEGRDLVGAAQLQMATRRIGPPAEWPTATDAGTGRGRGWTHCEAVSTGEESPYWHGWRIDAGWPMRSMTVSAWYAFASGEMEQYSPSLKPPRALLPSEHWFVGYRNRLPLTPIPAGFAINTLVYAAVVGAILTLPLSFFPIRRRLRARRGRCPGCGYDLAGARGAACPECGAAP